MTDSTPIIAANKLSISITDDAGRPHQLVNQLSLHIHPGETLGLVGESGCGKSLTAMSLMGLLPRPQAAVSGGEILYCGQAVNTQSAEAFRALRSRDIAVVFQDPMTALNPVHTVGQQIGETLRLHCPELSRRQRRERCLTLLHDVGMPAPQQRLASYPHQLSGGMRQRVMIAIALAAEPKLLIADEPTTALDVTIQAQILQLLKTLQRDRGMAMLFITHDLALVSQLADRVAVMYAGEIVEQNLAEKLFAEPKHPYTQGLLAALPSSAAAPKSRLNALGGQVPNIDAMPLGCRFANRCQYVNEVCKATPPMMESTDNGAEIACHHWRRTHG